MHGIKWNGVENLNGWWMSEKLDGVRAFWNGITFVSRNGMKINYPDWFVENIPQDISLDGELWSGRGTFDILMGTLKSGGADGWERIYFMVYDLPNSREPYEMRMRNLANILLPNQVQIVDMNRCRGSEDIGKYLATIVDLGGEGIMANKPRSLYSPMRVESLVKVKPLSDCEVKLLGVVPTGLYCQQSNGLNCIVKCHQQQVLDALPPVGSLLAVRHSGFLKNGTLRYPFYWRTMEQAQSLDHSFDWRSHSDRRDLFDMVGSRLSLKKLDDFHRVSLDDIKLCGGDVLLDNYFDGSLTQVFTTIYPNHTWYEWNFPQRVEPYFWNNRDNQRNFMDWLGNQICFKQMDDWYGVTSGQMKENRGVFLMNKYGSSLSKLVMAVYDAHPWQQVRFNAFWRWSNKGYQRDFMDRLGNHLNFKQKDDWYGITLKQIQQNGGGYLLKKFGSSPSKLVMAVYDVHPLQQFRFNMLPRNYWNNKDNQRNFVDWLGNQISFKQMDDWYGITCNQFTQNEGVSLLDKYRGSASKLVMALYDTHPWQQSCFKRKIKGSWKHNSIDPQPLSDSND